MIQTGGVYTSIVLSAKKEGIFVQTKTRDRNGRCVTIFFKSISGSGVKVTLLNKSQ